MNENYYVLGTRTRLGLLFVKDIIEVDDELEIKAVTDFRQAIIVSSLESCKDIIEAFEHEAILNIYRVNLEEVAE